MFLLWIADTDTYFPVSIYSSVVGAFFILRNKEIFFILRNKVFPLFATDRLTFEPLKLCSSLIWTTQIAPQKTEKPQENTTESYCEKKDGTLSHHQACLEADVKKKKNADVHITYLLSESNL